jgi:hypothetical protein
MNIRERTKKPVNCRRRGVGGGTGWRFSTAQLITNKTIHHSHTPQSALSAKNGLILPIGQLSTRGQGFFPSSPLTFFDATSVNCGKKKKKVNLKAHREGRTRSLQISDVNTSVKV